MAIQVLFVQGAGNGSHDEWDDKLVENLKRKLGPDYTIRYPRMPHEADPTYVDWKPALDLYARAIPQAIVRRLSGCDHQLNNDMSDVAADIRHVRAARRLPV